MEKRTPNRRPRRSPRGERAIITPPAPAIPTLRGIPRAPIAPPTPWRRPTRIGDPIARILRRRIPGRGRIY